MPPAAAAAEAAAVAVAIAAAARFSREQLRRRSTIRCHPAASRGPHGGSSHSSDSDAASLAAPAPLPPPPPLPGGLSPQELRRLEAAVPSAAAAVAAAAASEEGGWVAGSQRQPRPRSTDATATSVVLETPLEERSSAVRRPPCSTAERMAHAPASPRPLWAKPSWRSVVLSRTAAQSA